MTASLEALVSAVRQNYPPEVVPEILALLGRYGVEPHERERERVQLAVIALSKGQKHKLAELIDIAKQDYRDVLAWLETEPLSEAEGRRIEQEARNIIEKWGK